MNGVTDMKPTSLRLSDTDLGWLRERADAEERSVSSQIRHIIKQARIRNERESN